MYMIGGATRKQLPPQPEQWLVLWLQESVPFQHGVWNYWLQCVRYWNFDDLVEYQRIQVGGLLFSGLLISCLGAVMDAAMSVCSSMYEIYKQNMAMSRKDLF